MAITMPVKSVQRISGLIRDERGVPDDLGCSCFVDAGMKRMANGIARKVRAPKKMAVSSSPQRSANKPPSSMPPRLPRR